MTTMLSSSSGDDDEPIGPVLTRAEVRELDRRAVEQFGMNSLVLMENAGRGATDVLCSLGIDGPVVICCGKGNNAGDGFVVARHLELRGCVRGKLLQRRPGQHVDREAT